MFKVPGSRVSLPALHALTALHALLFNRPQPDPLKPDFLLHYQKTYVPYGFAENDRWINEINRSENKMSALPGKNIQNIRGRADHSAVAPVRLRG
jgi:hypothetical protein